MNGILRSIIIVAIISFFLSACGGESSGESTGTMSAGPDIQQLSEAAIRGQAIYIDPVNGCSTCHGVQGNEVGTIGGPVDGSCAVCGDLATLTAYNDASMPWAPGGFDPATCVGACAEDVSAYIYENFVLASAAPGDDNTPPPATPGINVNPTVGLTTTEAGGMASFTIVLDTLPTDNVDITLLSDDTTEGNVNPATVVFTPQNWNQLQTVMVTGMDDALLDGNISYSIMVTAASNDADYAAIIPADVTVTNTDDEVPPPGVVTITPTSGLVTTEDGGSDTFTIVLGTEPTADVSIGLSSNNAAEGTVLPASVVFNAANYNVPQTVTVTGVDDAAAPMVDGDIVYSVVTAAAISADPSYSGFAVDDVSVTNSDNDVLPIISAFTADPVSNAGSPIPYGGTVTLTWASDAENCIAGGANANNQWTGVLLPNGSQALTNLTTAGVNQFELTCTQGGIASVVSTVDVTVAPAPGAPTVTLTSDQLAGTELAYNGSATLTWSSTGAVGNCTASGGWTGDRDLNGTEVINNLIANTTFNLRCENAIGTATNVSTTVNVVAINPSLVFTVNNAASATIIRGDSVMLAWNPTDLQSCVASANPVNAAWTGARGAQAASSEMIANVQDSTEFTLTCVGVDGSNVVQSVNVTANADPDLALGMTAYDAQCAVCHAANGAGTALFATPIGPNMCSNNQTPGNEVCSDQATLQAYIATYMPTLLAQPDTCVGDCATNTAKYILNNFSVD